MERTRHSLLSIGAFATAAQLSLKALRLYDQLGILKPTLIDPASGYRYYHPEQLRTARLIRTMRQMNMPLATIRSVLAASPEAATALIDEYRTSVEAHAARVRLLARDLLAYLHGEEPTMAWEVEVRDVAPQCIISITRRLKVDQLEDHIWNTIRTLNERADAQGVDTGVPFGIYHGPINENDDGPIEVCLPVHGDVAPGGEIDARTLDATRLAYVDISGDQCHFPEILKAYDAVYDWVERNGYRHVGPPWEIYTSADGSTMQIAWPFAEKDN